MALVAAAPVAGAAIGVTGGAGTCGNGVVDDAAEWCDAPDRGVCDDLEVRDIACGAPESSVPCECCTTADCAIPFGEPICCHPAGAACAEPNECCSVSCTDGRCG